MLDKSIADIYSFLQSETERLGHTYLFETLSELLGDNQDLYLTVSSHHFKGISSKEIISKLEQDAL